MNGEQRLHLALQTTIGQAELLERMLSDPIQIELRQYRAKILAAHYRALRQQGFTEEQALYLCEE